MKIGSSVDCITIPMCLLMNKEITATAKLLYGIIDYYQMMSGGVCYETNDCLSHYDS